MKWRLELEGLPRLQGDVINWRIRAKERKGWHNAVAWAVRACGVPPPSVTLSQARITVTRYSSANTSPDADNMAYAAKPLIDGLIGLLIANDTPACIGTPVYRWEKTKRGGGRVTLEVATMSPEERCPTCGQEV